jgi:hypothetical protein
MELKNMRNSGTPKALAISALLGAAAAVALASPASAYVVCNGEGDCWHTDHIPAPVMFGIPMIGISTVHGLTTAGIGAIGTTAAAIGAMASG